MCLYLIKQINLLKHTLFRVVFQPSSFIFLALLPAVLFLFSPLSYGSQLNGE